MWDERRRGNEPRSAGGASGACKGGRSRLGVARERVRCEPVGLAHPTLPAGAVWRWPGGTPGGGCAPPPPERLGGRELRILPPPSKRLAGGQRDAPRISRGMTGSEPKTRRGTGLRLSSDDRGAQRAGSGAFRRPRFERAQRPLPLGTGSMGSSTAHRSLGGYARGYGLVSSEPSTRTLPRAEPPGMRRP